MRSQIELGKKIGIILKNCGVCKHNIQGITKNNEDLCEDCFEKVKKLVGKE